MKAQSTAKKPNSGETKRSGKSTVQRSKPTRTKRVRPLAAKQLLDMVEHINDGLVVLDKDWHYVYVNQKAAVMLQRQNPSDLIGKHIWTEFPEGVGQPFQLAYEKAMREQIPIVFEEHYEPWDLWFENRIYPSPDSLMILFTEITERKRAEAALQRGADLIRDLYNNAPCGYHSLDKDGVFIEINDTELGWLGLRREEVIGKMRLEDVLTSDGQKSFLKNFPQFKEQGSIRNVEIQLACRDGTLRSVLLSATAIKDGAGNYMMSRTTLYDITERKRAEEQVSLLQTIMMEVVASHDLSSALQVVLHRVCEKTGWVYGQAWVPRQDKSVLDCDAAWFSDAGLEKFRAVSVGLSLPLGRGLPGRVWSSKQPVWLEDATLDPNFPRAESAKESGLKAALAVPILADDEIVAVIEFFLSEQRAEDTRLVKVIAAVAAQLGLVLERKRMEGLLEERQHLLQKILDTEPGTVYIYDLEERRNVYVNRHWLSEFGYTPEETQAMGDELLIRIFHPDDLELISAHHENWRRAGEGDIREIEYRVRMKTDEWRWVHSHEAAFVYDESGKVKQILGISYEITPRKLAQEALRRNEQQLGQIYDTVSDIIFLLSIEADDRYRFVSVNKAFLRTTGLQSDQVVGRYADEIIPPSSQPLVFGNYKKAIQERVPVIWEEVSEYPAGRKTAIVTVNAVYDEAGICTHLVGAVHDITERKKMEDAVLKERDFSEAMLNSLPGALYFYDQTGKFLRWNRNFEVVTGYSAEEIARMNPLDFFKGEEKDYIAQRIQEVFAKGESDAEANFVTKNGELIPYYFTGRRLDIEGSLYLIGMGIDITQRKRAEEEKVQLLHNLKERVKELTALHATMELLQHDRGGTTELLQAITDLIPIAWQYPEITAARLVFAGIETQTPNFTPTPWILSSYFSTSSDEGLIEVAYLREAPPEEEGPFLAEERRLLDSLADMLRLHFERRRVEEELRNLNIELEQRIEARTEELAAAMIRAQESDKLKSAFLATMSHELRTPLNSIIGFTGVILQGLAGPLNEEQTKQLNMTRDSARHLLALINDVLDISKIEAGQLEILKRPFNMRQAIESAVRVVQPLALKKNLQLATSIGGKVGIINNDRRRVEQVLINLVNNAIKFTERGEVSVECQIRNDWLETIVRDSGIGIKPEDIDRLFKPFQQIDTGLARGHEGTGLGLSICKRLVTAMGGDITVQSQWGVGSAFKFTLPI